MDFRFTFLVFMLLAGIIAGPIATIFALNSLFGLAIEVNAVNWFSALWLTIIVGGGLVSGNKKS
jgi:hypothetical protein